MFLPIGPGGLVSKDWEELDANAIRLEIIGWGPSLVGHDLDT